MIGHVNLFGDDIWMVLTFEEIVVGNASTEINHSLQLLYLVINFWISSLDHLQAFKVPAIINVVDKLELTGTGKVVRT